MCLIGSSERPLSDPSCFLLLALFTFSSLLLLFLCLPLLSSYTSYSSSFSTSSTT